MRANSLAWAVLLLLAPTGPQGAELPPPSAALAAMSFLAGTWSGEWGDGRFVAHYTTPEGGKVISFSELYEDDEVVFHEFEVFDERDGKLVFSPFPGGEPAVRLELAELDAAARRVVFENPEKDFPTRIEYHRRTDENLVITLSDPYHASDRVQVFDLRRVPETEDRRSTVRLDEPRIAPLAKGEWTEEQHAYLEPYEQAGRLYNVFATAARHPDFARSFDAFALGHVNNDASSTLPLRHRELLILRIGWLSRSEYEWAQHARIARTIGLTDEELLRIVEGPDAAAWSPFEAALLRAADELHADAFITEETWAALSREYETRQLIDVVATVGTYSLVSMMLNTLGVQLDEGLGGFPERR